MIRRFVTRIYYKLIGMDPSKMEMVKYWKRAEAVEAKLTKQDGATTMVMADEKYPIWGFPRGHLLIPQSKTFVGEVRTLDDQIAKYGAFSVLKHEVKQMFNNAWRKLEEGLPREQVIAEAKRELFKALDIVDLLRYDLVPPQSMTPSIREIYRALTKIGCPDKLRDVLTLILQEDDGYRYRVEWLAIWIPLIRINPVKIFDKGLRMIEESEVIGDMKRKIKLLRRIVMLGMEDPNIKKMFIKFFREVKWRKVRITAGGRYHFRAKYFRVDSDVLEY